MVNTGVLERTEVDAGVLVDDLLSALYIVTRTADWEDRFDFVRAAVEAANRAYPTSYPPEQQKAVVDLLGRVESHPSYQGMVQRAETDPEFKRKANVLAEYRRHVSALQEVIGGMSRGITPDKAEAYATVISAAALFHYQKGGYLPQGESRDLFNKIDSARSKLPGRLDYGRKI